MMWNILRTLDKEFSMEDKSCKLCWLALIYSEITRIREVDLVLDI